jgi:hypothetical protein
MDENQTGLIDKILKNKVISSAIFILCVSISITLVIAVYQGREVTFYPPKIGPKPVDCPSCPPCPQPLPCNCVKDCPCPPCNRTDEVPFLYPLGGKLHIYKNANDPVAAGLPSDANTYIITNDSSRPIATERVTLPDGVQSIEQLRFKVAFEYHADSTDSPAILDFVLKDGKGQQIRLGTHDFLPKGPTKQKESEEFSFDIRRSFNDKEITIEIKPVSAGDFGFYLYKIDGLLMVKGKECK